MAHGAETDTPQPGFDHWVSFKGQGSYLPDANGLNVDGRKVPQKGYITDELTDYALDWIGKRAQGKPVDDASRSQGGAFRIHPRRAPCRPLCQRDVPLSRDDEARASRAARCGCRTSATAGTASTSPITVRSTSADYYKRYMETLLAVDEGLARIMDLLDQRGELDDTLILYMGDNGFMFGEHGLIDKRAAYEESMRVPMIARCPSLFGHGVVEQVVANIDVAPTMLAAAGLEAPADMAGADMLPLARGEKVPWRSELLYEYYWERNFPQTPTVHALREDRYKYMHFHGIWDLDELYDLAADPHETNNLLAAAGA
jgi:N-acetylglucosamine-6-sulfatase